MPRPSTSSAACPAVAALLVVYIAAAGFGCADDSRNGEVLSGTVEATDAHLGFPAPGLLARVAVVEGQRVDAGMELAALDQDEHRARLAEADARIATAEANLAELERGSRSEEVGQARAAFRGAASRLADAEREHERARQLLAEQVIAQAAYDKARLGLEQARAARDQARKKLELLRAGATEEQVAAQEGQLAQAKAGRQALEATLRKMTARAPFAGVVTVRHREPGEIVPAGAPVLTLMNPDDRWVRLYLPETRLGAVSLGQHVSITSDTFPDKRYAGEVTFISSEAEFTPKNVQTREERVKLVYAVKVRIRGDDALELKPGMAADVSWKAPP